VKVLEPCWNLPFDPADVTFHRDHCDCDGGWRPKRGPCVRGCHAIDALLGKT
jgi:hypothetical protein